MSPDDVHVSPEGVDGPVGLGHGHHGLGLGVLKGGVPLAAKGHGHGEVLCPGLVRLHGSCVMMEWLPLTRVPVPVKSRCLKFVVSGGGALIKRHYLDVHVKVVPDPVHDIGECGAELLPVSLVVGDQMTVAVPELPELLLRHAAGLDLADELVVDAEVPRGPEQVTHDDHVPGGVGPVIPGVTMTSV